MPHSLTFTSPNTILVPSTKFLISLPDEKLDTTIPYGYDQIHVRVCPNLKELVVRTEEPGAGLEEIRISVMDCERLEKVTFVSEMRVYEFYSLRCPLLHTIPEHVTHIASIDCSSLNTLPEDYSSIALIRCNGVEGEFTLPETVYNAMFVECESITRINLPRTRFIRCDVHKMPNIITIDNHVSHIDSYLTVMDCPKLLNIIGIASKTKGCYWIHRERHQLVKKLQAWFKRVGFANRLLRVIPQISEVWYSPDCKGGWFHVRRLVSTYAASQSPLQTFSPPPSILPLSRPGTPIHYNPHLEHTLLISSLSPLSPNLGPSPSLYQGPILECQVASL